MGPTGEGPGEDGIRREKKGIIFQPQHTVNPILSLLLSSHMRVAIEG